MSPGNLFFSVICLFLLESGLSAETKLAQHQRKSGQQEQQTERPQEAVALQRLAGRAYAIGDYKSAYEYSTKICDLVPNDIYSHLLRGEISFAAGRMNESVKAYDKAIGLQPSIEPRLWQRGLALYYADRFADGVRQFETHQTVNSQDVENAVWHLLCAAKISDVENARKKLIPITGDKRVPMSQIYEMFAGRMTPEDVLDRARNTKTKTEPENQRELQLYYAHLYTGLYHEMLGKPEAARAALEKAAKNNPLGKTNFMGQVARVHLNLRWPDKSRK